jgi:hypothetical protein
MPNPDQILTALTALANQWKPLAVAWHVYFAVLIGLAIGLHPSRRLTGILLSLPLISVSVLAWSSGNPFNGTLFAVAAVALIVLAVRLPKDRVYLAPTWIVVAGAVMFIFGWVYPHFLETTSLLPYLYAAPTGLIPCPTLSIVIGTALILDGLQSRAWSLVLAAMGIFYGVFGAMRLGVTMDFVLLVGALVLGTIVLIPRAASRKPAMVH